MTPILVLRVPGLVAWIRGRLIPGLQEGNRQGESHHDSRVKHYPIQP